VKTNVLIIESERGWGQRVDEIIEFETRELAEEYAKNYNAKYNNEPEVPGWYMYAKVSE
jgi:hypothetical protein